jgi:hypothetical protein
MRLDVPNNNKPKTTFYIVYAVLCYVVEITFLHHHNKGILDKMCYIFLESLALADSLRSGFNRPHESIATHVKNPEITAKYFLFLRRFFRTFLGRA